MAIHVTVNSNPMCINRSKLFLTDREVVKKNEWNRRRKLRLQQVRQQARDLASNLRKKCEDEKELNVKQECEENERELKEWQSKQLRKLQKEFDNCIAAIGAGHRTAFCQAEDEENIKEKSELRDALAKARGDLARERAKVNAVLAKPTSVPNKRSPPKRVDIRPQAERIDLRNALQKNKVKQKTPVKSWENKPCPQKKRNQVTVELRANHLTESSVDSPTIPRQQQKPAIRRQYSSSPPRKSTNLKQVTICASDDSDDSNATWPPRSARVTKRNLSPQKVRFYNHDERVCKEYVKPSSSVTHLREQCNDVMEKYVEKEEGEVAKRAEFDEMLKKRINFRGQKALKKERLEREFKTMTRQLTEIDKQQKIARIFEFPYPVTQPKESKRKEGERPTIPQRPSTSKEPSVDVYQEMKKCFEIGTLCGDKRNQKLQKQSKKPENPFTLKNLIKDLEKERDLLLNSSLEKSPFKDLLQTSDREENLQKNAGQKISPQKISRKSLDKASTAGKIKECDDAQKAARSENEEKIASAVNTDNVARKEKHPHPIEVNVITNPLCGCCKACNCEKVQREVPVNSDTGEKQKIRNKGSAIHQQSNSIELTEEDELNPAKSVKEDATVLRNSRSSLDKISSIHVKATQNPCSVPELDGPGNGIKITVTVREKSPNLDNEVVDDQVPLTQVPTGEILDNDIPWHGRLKCDNDRTNSSSSFCSPPNKLAPTQEAILNAILLKMCLKNNNPELHKYIKRLLWMSKANIEKLPVSSSSEISIHSDIFPEIKMDPTTGTYFLKDKTKTHKKIDFREPNSQTEISSEDKKTRKKVVQINTSSDESTPVSKKSDEPNSPQSNLADEYSFRLQQLIEMLNEASPGHRISELGCNESASSYVGPTIVERLETNSEMVDFGCNSTVTSTNEGWTFQDKKNINISNFKDHEDSSFIRNNITTLGLPFELLPKPFSLAEADIRQQLKEKPPVSSKKYRVQDLLPHELSAIPEVSSQICNLDQEILFSRNFNQQKSDLVKQDYETDISDVSTICPATPKISLDKRSKKKTIVENSIGDLDELCDVLDTSSLSILSHMSNESLIGTDRDVIGKGVSVNSILESPSEYIEEVFSSLGVGWALSTFRKTRQSRQRDSTSTTSTSNESNNHFQERIRTKSVSKLIGKLGHSHSTPKKTVEVNYTTSSSVSDELRKKFNALKNDRMSLTPPDLTLNVPPLGRLSNYNNSDSSTSVQLKHPKCNH